MIKYQKEADVKRRKLKSWVKYIKLKTLITDFYEILDITKERISDLEDTVGITQNASQSYKW